MHLIKLKMVQEFDCSRDSWGLCCCMNEHMMKFSVVVWIVWVLVQYSYMYACHCWFIVFPRTMIIAPNIKELITESSLKLAMWIMISYNLIQNFLLCLLISSWKTLRWCLMINHFFPIIPWYSSAIAWRFASFTSHYLLKSVDVFVL